jgi:hypothetical protein
MKVAASYAAAPHGIEAERVALGARPKRLKDAFSPKALAREREKAAARDYIRERRREPGYCERQARRQRELDAGAASRTGRPRLTYEQRLARGREQRAAARARDRALAADPAALKAGLERLIERLRK